MLYLSQYEIEYCVRHTCHNPNSAAARAARFLRDFVEEVNAHSDGWAHWAAPVRAASHMMMLARGQRTINPKAFERALTPIKSFMTRKGYAAGMTMPKIEGEV